jgi:steroid delta-isomerase-like uncharacterized protein
MVSQEQKAIIERYFHDVFGRGDFSALDELLAPDFVTYDPSGHIGGHGTEAFKTWLQWYLARFTDAQWTLHDMIAEEEKVVVRYSGTPVYLGDFFDIPSTRQRVKEMGILIFRIKDEKIQELWSALSDLELVLELGASITYKAK